MADGTKKYDVPSTWVTFDDKNDTSSVEQRNRPSSGPNGLSLKSLSVSSCNNAENTSLLDLDIDVEIPATNLRPTTSDSVNLFNVLSSRVQKVSHSSAGILVNLDYEITNRLSTLPFMTELGNQIRPSSVDTGLNGSIGSPQNPFDDMNETGSTPMSSRSSSASHSFHHSESMDRVRDNSVDSMSTDSDITASKSFEALTDLDPWRDAESPSTPEYRQFPHHNIIEHPQPAPRVHSSSHIHLMQLASTAVAIRAASLANVEQKPQLPPRPDPNKILIASIDSQIVSPTSENPKYRRQLPLPPSEPSPSLRPAPFPVPVATSAVSSPRSSVFNLTSQPSLRSINTKSPQIIDRIYTTTSQSSRTPPRVRNIPDIQLKGPPRCCLMTPNRLITGGHHLRIWDLKCAQESCKYLPNSTTPHSSSGGTRITSLSIRPECTPEEEGKIIWAGLGDGTIWAVDTLRGEIIERRTSAHYGAVQHILKGAGRSLWTLDDNGTLQIWKPQAQQSSPPPINTASSANSSPVVLEPSSHYNRHINEQNGSNSSPNHKQESSNVVSLENRPETFRVMSKASQAVLIPFTNELWTATLTGTNDGGGSGNNIANHGSGANGVSGAGLGNHINNRSATIEIFAPAHSTVIARLNSAIDGSGNLTTLSYSRKNPDYVFSGHDNGKISIWCCRSRRRVAVVDMAYNHRITSMIPLVGNHIWIGTHTGKMCVLELPPLNYVGVNPQTPRSANPQNNNLSGENVVNGSKASTSINGSPSKSNGHAKLLKQWSVYQNASICSIVEEEGGGAGCGWNTDLVRLATWNDNGLVTFWRSNLGMEFIENRILYKDIAEVSTSPLNIQICSWNIGSTKPEALDSSGAPSIRFLHNWLREVPDADIIVVGLQEVVDLESKKVIGKSFLKRANAQTSPEAKQEMRYQLWQDRLTRVLRETSGGSEGGPSYRLLMRQSLVGLFLCVFIKDSLPPRVTGTAATVVKTGLGGYHGNKGSVAFRLIVDSTSICFLNCHLAAGQSHTVQRHSDATTIIRDVRFPPTLHLPTGVFMNGSDGACCTDHEYVFLFGDLNYRIDGHRSRICDLIVKQDWESLRQTDQLTCALRTLRSHPITEFVEVAELAFAPTYKYDVGTDNYDTSDKKRLPAWCDRILIKTSPFGPSTAPSGSKVPRHQALSYRKYDVRVSDHRPISSGVTIQTKSLDPIMLRSKTQSHDETWNQVVRDNILESRITWETVSHNLSRQEAEVKAKKYLKYVER